MHLRALVVPFVLVFVVLAGACSSGGGGQPPAVADNPAAKAKADEIFTQRCTPCHGLEGRGNGPASATLTPRPRNFHDKSWQSQVTNEHIERIIQYGGAAVGKSPAMPANPDLTGNREVVVALRKHIRTFDRD
ncbi:MAG TPA: c-type cytochrome [Haliangiales bacterium]|nr:c-type cytochrome [Haliangiales bacterium]